MVEDPDQVADLLRRQGARGASRDELARTHAEFTQVSPEAGQLDEEALADLAGRDPDAAARLVAALGRAFDPRLRAAARTLAARLPGDRAAHRRPRPDRQPAGGHPPRPDRRRHRPGRHPRRAGRRAALAGRAPAHPQLAGRRPGVRARRRRVGLGRRGRAGGRRADGVGAGPADAAGRRAGGGGVLVHRGGAAAADGRRAPGGRHRPAVRPARRRDDEPGPGAPDGRPAARPDPHRGARRAAAVRRHAHRQPRPGPGGGGSGPRGRAAARARAVR
ncbi:Conserved protein of unknown function [Modestobacter italicus]|uniref:Uncharacterized protein n=1 Tax=Modestobacter italicus (strain DSM 44449 / CECT 9708 / BC 501) TaxID=2732864 RepID=I4F571_MODI5|nr:Conserved protein of unknown function [Modestobacter marinus]